MFSRGRNRMLRWFVYTQKFLHQNTNDRGIKRFVLQIQTAWSVRLPIGQLAEKLV